MFEFKSELKISANLLLAYAEDSSCPVVQDVQRDVDIDISTVQLPEVRGKATGEAAHSPSLQPSGAHCSFAQELQDSGQVCSADKLQGHAHRTLILTASHLQFPGVECLLACCSGAEGSGEEDRVPGEQKQSAFQA